MASSNANKLAKQANELDNVVNDTTSFIYDRSAAERAKAYTTKASGSFVTHFVLRRVLTDLIISPPLLLRLLSYARISLSIFNIVRQ